MSRCVYFTPGGVRIDLLLERDDVPIRTQDTVRLVSVGAFGTQVVDIQPGVQTAPLIVRGATLPTKVQPESTVSLPVSVSACVRISRRKSLLDRASVTE